MIAESLVALRNQLNAFIVARMPEYLESPPGVLTDLINQEGDLVVGQGERADDDVILITLINVEEETVGKDQSFYRRNPDNTQSVLNPTVKLNLYVLFSTYSGKADNERYENCLELLSYVTRFFQFRFVFTRDDTPELPVQVEKLIVELMSPTFEEQNHLWGALGAKYIPSVIYKVRLLPVREIEESAEAPLIEEVETEEVMIG